MYGFGVNKLHYLFTIVLLCAQNLAEKYDEETFLLYKNKVRRMFEHAYGGYMQNAFPLDELRPLTCDGQDTWGSYSLTLIDSLDTLVVLGNFSEFRRVVDILLKTLNFDKDLNVSVFETNIRVVGGLLSAHLLSKRAGLELEEGWPCSGPLLRLAEKVARKLLPAFNTPTGMPYGTVNLLYGVPKGETSITCTAGVGTFLIEFGTLTQLTGATIFMETALRALQSLWSFRSPIGLVGNHIDVLTGKWTALDSSIGAGVDSYYEYLVKGSMLFGYPDLMKMFLEYKSAIQKYLRRDDWYLWAQMQKGSITHPLFQSLETFWPGLLSLTGDIESGMKTLHNYHQIMQQYGFTPEMYNIQSSEVHNSKEGYPLRPELVESAMYLYRATKDPYLVEIVIDVVENIENICKTSCGYATSISCVLPDNHQESTIRYKLCKLLDEVKNVKTHQLDNRMESFFLAETLKYLYMFFDRENFLNQDAANSTVIMTPRGKCVIHTGGYVFNTEAHFVDAAALYCCSSNKQQDEDELRRMMNHIDLVDLLTGDDDTDDDYSIYLQKANLKFDNDKVNDNPQSSDGEANPCNSTDDDYERKTRINVVEMPLDPDGVLVAQQALICHSHIPPFLVNVPMHLVCNSDRFYYELQIITPHHPSITVQSDSSANVARPGSDCSIDGSSDKFGYTSKKIGNEEVNVPTKPLYFENMFELLSCSPRSFVARLSVNGEVFDEDE
ncbi:hypothetical protein HELRODRAFT_194877 [Helobdella robusta]|uniref:alpha-1,2-Mannosidase n=1 Tax=Helobdella robusta TaxID=6412 RepID=T1FWI6_HELRO|nr:hypothetical protein HELRODRAFT_194877 [Helobdella robusta]ESO11230.1 hypothetical protein HELRODRAFT_194877 [Helobdella robusta]